MLRTNHDRFAKPRRSQGPRRWTAGTERGCAALSASISRLRRAGVVEQPARVAILYSQTSTLQIPPAMFSWQRTPYLFDLERTYTASRFLDVKTTFITERQIDRGKLAGFPVLLIPGAQALPARIVDKIQDYCASAFAAKIASVQDGATDSNPVAPPVQDFACSTD